MGHNKITAFILYGEADFFFPEIGYVALALVFIHNILHAVNQLTNLS